MAALYPYKVLNHIEFKDISVPAQRYVHKFVKQRNEVTKLKHHEKDFLFRVLETLHDADDHHRAIGGDVHERAIQSDSLLGFFEVAIDPVRDAFELLFLVFLTVE